MSGLLHRVWVDLKCERCGKIRETVIQFHNYLITYEGPDYKIGEHVSDPYMVVGETYEGTADRYCPPCFRKWTEAQSSLSYASLVELIEQGRVTATDRDTGATLTTNDVLEYGRKYTNLEYLDVTGPFFDEFQLILDNERMVEDLNSIEAFPYLNWDEFLELHSPLLERRMIEAGWKSPGLTFEDFNIYLDDDRRLVVKDVNGKRLLERGEREA
jgi:hypothetical protein